jgi:predicted HAD superfamily phosphohydrolase
MLHAVNTAGGLAVAYNADERSLPCATVGLASTHLSDLKAVIDAWQEGGRDGVEKVVREKEKLGGEGDRDNLNWIPDQSDVQAVLDTHQRIRRVVLQQAGKAR